MRQSNSLVCDRSMKRGDKCIRPKPDSKIEAGDVLIASGYAGGVESLRELVSP
jgi:uncharacterized protein with PhoU and TrkA domain